MKQWVSLANYNFGGNDNNCNAAGTGAGSSQCGFNNVHLTQFMTDKNGNDGSQAANVLVRRTHHQYATDPFFLPNGMHPAIRV